VRGLGVPWPARADLGPDPEKPFGLYVHETIVSSQRLSGDDEPFTSLPSRKGPPGSGCGLHYLDPDLSRDWRLNTKRHLAEPTVATPLSGRQRWLRTYRFRSREALARDE